MSVVQPVCRPRDVEETAGAGRRAPRRAARTRTRRVPRPRVARASPSDPAPSGWSAHSTAQLQLLRNTPPGGYICV